MHFFPATVLLASAPLLINAAAAPKYATQSCTSTFEDYSEDRFTEAPVPGPYNGLNWNLNKGPYTYDAGFCFNVCPSSPPVYVNFFQTDAPKSANITTVYPRSKVIDFSLQQFDFGCASSTKSVDSQGTVYETPIPANCTITVNGYKTAKPVGSKGPDVKAVFRYTPQIGHAPNTGAPNAQMTTAVLPATFKNLKLVTFDGALVKGKKATYYDSPAEVRLDTFQYITRNLTKSA